MTTTCPTCDWENESGTYCERCRTNLLTGEPPEPAGAPRLVLVMGAERVQYERMVEEDQREQVPFPESFETRRFEPDSTTVTVGRISPGKPADVDIALTGDAADPGVSHHQCLFEADDEGWVLRDGTGTDASTNGTYVNERSESLGPAEAHRLSDGDRIYIGAWTCLTVSLG